MSGMESAKFHPSLLAALHARNYRECLERHARYKQLCSAQEFRFTDTTATVETPFLSDVADLRTVWLDFNAPVPDDVLAAHAIILWHGPKIDAALIARLKNCRVIIRNGVGFDTVDIAAAAQKVQRSAAGEAYAQHEAQARVTASVARSRSVRSPPSTLPWSPM